MASGTSEPVYSINWNPPKKPDYIRVKVDTPGVKIVGMFNKKLDPKSADVVANFEGNQATLDVTLKQGTKAGTVYHLQLNSDDLKDNLVAPEPQSYYEVKENNQVMLFLRKR